MTAWNKMVDVTNAALAVLKKQPRRCWNVDTLRDLVSKSVDQSVNEIEIADALMRLAAAGIITFDAQNSVRVDVANLHAYSQQQLAAQ